MKPIRLELPTSFAVGPVNAYLFAAPEPILVDTGVKSDESWLALVAGLNAHGLSVADLDKVIITHPHIDHFGLASRLVEQSDAQVYVSELGKEWLVDFPSMWQKRILFYKDSLLRQVGFSSGMSDTILETFRQSTDYANSVPENRVSTFGLDDKLHLGGAEWQVIHAPGHAFHQTCFYQPVTRQFLSADMLLAKTPTPIVERPHSGTKRIPSLPQFIDSLALVESLDIDVVYPGHGKPFTNHRAVINRQRTRIHTRKEECLKLINDGNRTVAELTNKMYAHLPIQFRFAGLWMLIGYLDLLRMEGMISEEERDGVWHYKPLH